MKIKNIAWNLGGLGGPLIVAALTIPSLIGMIGMERFGLLGLAWGLIGFAGIFDLGIGRATTQTIARLRGSGQLDQVPAVLKTAATLSFRTGLVGSALLSLAVLAGAHTYIKYAAGLNTEVTIAAYLLALAIPIQSMSAMFRGVNEAFENFREISLIRIGLGIANFLGPFCVAIFTANLAALVCTLLISRLIAFFLFRRFAQVCLARELPIEAKGVPVHISTAIAKQLLSFGGWFTVSSLISPVLVMSDRFFIGALISASAVATYTIPFEVVTQSLIIVGAISGVAFPSLSVLVHSQPEKSKAMFRTWLLRVAVIMFVVTTLCALLLPFILPWWIGPKLPIESVLIGQILCMGIFMNSLGSMYFALLHAHGRADITAKLHLLELPLYLFVLYFMVSHFAVVGAALTWAGRMMLDAIFLWVAYSMYLPNVLVKKYTK
jgi:O-antigen/teichoic acid export membrane protein